MKLTKGGKNGMKDGKLGSSFSSLSFEIPSSAFLILCCILSLRTYKNFHDIITSGGKRGIESRKQAS